MNHRATFGNTSRKTSRWVLLLYLAVLAVTGAAHTCAGSSPAGSDTHHAIAVVAESGNHGCPTCDLHRATTSALVATRAVVALLPRDACTFGESAVSSPSSRALTQLSRGPPAA